MDIILEYEDGRAVRVEHDLTTFAAAISFALDLADRASRFTGDGHAPPKFVKIYRIGLLELSIAVIPGGLLAPQGEQQPLPM